MAEGENILVIGDNAAGKSTLVDRFVLRRPYDRVQSIAFKDTYGVSDSSYYLQKRWNQIEIDPEFNPTVRQPLERLLGQPIESLLDSAAAESPSDESQGANNWPARILDFFGLRPLLDEYLISLSSGELRRFHLAKALLRHPQILVIDNPFIGLDASTRDMLSSLLDELAARGIQLILVMSRLDVIPQCITHFVRIDGMQASPKIPREAFLKEVADGASLSLSDNAAGTPLDVEAGGQSIEARVEAFPVKDLSQESFYPQQSGAEIIRCNAVTIRYGSRIILKDLDWVVHEGEKWVVSGANGSGKSTLLSCVCADNPQSYACDIELFSHRRGSGETIWDIKRHIGYVSPEMHRAYQKNIPAENVVASGLFDTVGLFQHATPEQMALCHEWMEIFGIRDVAERSFLKLSSGEQRLCLLARAFVKDPELLILDEPFHGLDAHRSEMAKHIIEAFVRRPHKTLILISHFPSEYPPCITHELHLQK